MLYIKKANLTDCVEQWECSRLMPLDENGFENCDYDISYEDFCSKALPRMLDEEQGINLPEGYVPCTQYYLWLDKKCIGIFHFRHCLNDFLRNGSGHIGYGLLKEYRGKGYGTMGLYLMVKEAFKIIKEDEVYLSANIDNPASVSVQKHCGAVVHHSDDKKVYTRISKKALADSTYFINKFYTDICNEDERLLQRAGKVEYYITTTFIDKYLKRGMKLFEIGSGTGRYSLHYADMGYSVNALELVEHNIEVCKSHIKKSMDICVKQGNALDLSGYDDCSFDFTLVLGPAYHLYTKEDLSKAISEALRVTKKGGYIAVSYLTSDSIVLDDWPLFSSQFINGTGSAYDEHYKIINKSEGLFAAYYIEEFLQIMKGYPVKLLHNVATDGLSRILRDRLDAMSEQEFELWIKYNLSICERKDLQGYSSHMLYLGQKL